MCKTMEIWNRVIHLLYPAQVDSLPVEPLKMLKPGALVKLKAMTPVQTCKLIILTV